MANPYGINFATAYGRPIVEALGGQFTPEKAKFFQAWGLAEGTEARFNPYATTRSGYPGETIFNSVGVKEFPDRATGIRATVDTLQNGYYDHIVELLRDPKATAVQLAQAVANSPWGTGAGVLRVLGASMPEIDQAVAQSGVDASAEKRTAFQSVYEDEERRDRYNEISDVIQQSVFTPSSQYLGSLQRGGPGARMVSSLSQQWQQQLQQRVPQVRAKIAELAGVKGEAPPSPADEVGPVDYTTPVNEVKPGGGWGGSYNKAKAFADIGTSLGLSVWSEKRDTKYTASGNPSDHWVGSKNAYAFDLSNGNAPTAEMDSAAIQMMAMLGERYDGKSELVFTKTIGNYRYQILYRTDVGGNHHNHIHIGVRRVGG